MANLVRDKETVKPDGSELLKLPHDVRIREASLFVDERGSLCEMYDPRWKLSVAKKYIAYAYFFTSRPGVIKGWGMHKKHEDCYFLISGEMELVLYDGRKNSPTYGLVSKIYLSEEHRRTVTIPIGVWHAERNIGTKDNLTVNFPSRLYDHKSPDKYRLPIDTDEIPFSFGDHRYGW